MEDAAQTDKRTATGKIIAPKVAKGRNLALLEEIKQREVAKTTSKSRILASGNLQVDKDCEVKNVSGVLEDYSCLLQVDDISYNDDQ